MLCSLAWHYIHEAWYVPLSRLKLLHREDLGTVGAPSIEHATSAWNKEYVEQGQAPILPEVEAKASDDIALQERFMDRMRLHGEVHAVEVTRLR